MSDSKITRSGLEAILSLFNKAIRGDAEDWVNLLTVQGRSTAVTFLTSYLAHCRMASRQMEKIAPDAEASRIIIDIFRGWAFGLSHLGLDIEPGVADDLANYATNYLSASWLLIAGKKGRKPREEATDGNPASIRTGDSNGDRCPGDAGIVADDGGGDGHSGEQREV